MPPASSESNNSNADLAVCRELLRKGSKSFSAASRLLPHEVRESATILYAFCRDADDLIDTQQGGADAIAQLRGRLDHIYSGTPRAFATDRALAHVVTRHDLPRALLDGLIEGFEWDVQNRRYSTLAELETYAARVAGTIGAMMAVLMGVTAPSAIARACDLGVAMQLTNIARDVGDDARAGRLYLPLDALHDAGIDVDQWLKNPQVNDAIRSVVRDLLCAADRLYARVGCGVAQLPPACRPGINAARFIYAEIGRVVQRSDYDSVSSRAYVPRYRKAWLLLSAWAPVIPSVVAEVAPPLAATRHLVDAVAVSVPRSAEALSALPWWHLKSRALWLIDLFERMERRERVAALGAPRQQEWS